MKSARRELKKKLPRHKLRSSYIEREKYRKFEPVFLKCMYTFKSICQWKNIVNLIYLEFPFYASSLRVLPHAIEPSSSTQQSPSAPRKETEETKVNSKPTANWIQPNTVRLDIACLEVENVICIDERRNFNNFDFSTPFSYILFFCLMCVSRFMIWNKPSSKI